jgi:hypothetical protein
MIEEPSVLFGETSLLTRRSRPSSEDVRTGASSSPLSFAAPSSKVYSLCANNFGGCERFVFASEVTRSVRARREAEKFGDFTMLPSWWAPVQLRSPIERISDLIRRQRNFRDGSDANLGGATWLSICLSPVVQLM